VYIGAPEGVQDPVETWQVRLFASLDGGLTWVDRPGPVLPGRSGGLDTSGSVHGVDSVAATFRADGTLQVVASIAGMPFAGGVFWTETEDLGLTWSEPLHVPDTYSVARAVATSGHLWVGGESSFDPMVLAKAWNSSRWIHFQPEGPACREIGVPLEIDGRLLALCAVIDRQPGTVEYVATRAISIVELNPENGTYAQVTQVRERLCYPPWDLVPLPDGRLFVHTECQRDMGKPIMSMVVLAWLVDLDQGTWTEVKGPVGASPDLDPSEGIWFMAAHGDSQGLVHVLVGASRRDPLDHVRHETTRYIAWSPNDDSVMLSADFVDVPWVGDDPAGASPLARAYGHLGLWVARGGKPWDGSIAVQGNGAMASWNAEIGIAFQGMSLGAETK
jgi:hypothetical protein